MIGIHGKSTAETCEWAALRALGVLTADERAAYERHLAEGCPVCDSDLRSFEEVAGQLGLAAAPVQPPPSLRERLLDSIAGDTETKSAEELGEGAQEPPEGILFNQGGVLISRSDEMSWQAAPLPGVFSKVLFNDPKRPYTTQLVRMEPGTTYPSHRHTEVEELYMLEGDLWVEGLKMGPGDYCRGEPDSIHGQVRTDSGALFLVLSSPRDEILA